MVDLLLNVLQVVWGVLCLSLFCSALLCVHFAIILKRKRKLNQLCYYCLTDVLLL